LQKQRAVARGHPAIGMPGGIADDIRLGLNNEAAHDAFRQLAHHYLPDEIAGKCGGIGRKPGARERWKVVAAGFHEIRSTHCAREGPGSKGSPKYWISRATLPSRNSMMLTV